MKTLLVIALSVLTHFTLTGQLQDPLLKAFADSYTQEAAGLYQEAIAAMQPYYAADSYEINLRLGWLYYLQGDYPVSQTHYRQAMNLLPYAIEAKFGYTLPVAGQGNWNEVEKTYEEILKIDPQNTLANFRMGQLYYERQDYENAYKHAEKVVNLYPFDYDAVLLFAWINYQAGNKPRARTLFKKAQRIYPDSESAAEGLKLVEAK